MGFVKSMPKTFSILLAGVCLFLLSWSAPDTASATDYYVSTSGSDEGTGESGDPWKTLHHAIDHINGLGTGTYTLNVASGTYSIAATEEADAELILSQGNVTIQGASGGGSLIDGTGAEVWTKGLEITGSNVIVRHLYITRFSYGIKIDGSSPEISRNTLYDNGSNIGITAGNGQTASPTIKNNLIYEATASTVSCGIYIGGNSGSTVVPAIYHNTINGGTGDGIYMEGPTDAPIIKYNIITNFGQYGIENYEGIGNPVIDYNDVWGNAHGSYDNCTAGAHDISQDPKYGSHTLLGTSPCINAIPTGDPPNDPVTVDRNGTARPYGSGYDMGCYEDTTLPAVATTTPSSITSITASSGGSFTSGGGSAVTVRGVCWNTSANPTVALPTKTTDGTGTGSFTSDITGLSPATEYHVRAYATNTAGTAYGSDLTFTTAVPAGTYYVDISLGTDDASHGTSSGTGAWKTLHYAISQINAGPSGTYVLIMAAGTYSKENGEADTAITLSQSTVTIVGADDNTIGASNSIINGTDATTWTKGLKITGSNVIIRGVSITNFTATGGSGIEINGSSGDEVRNCKIFNNYEGIVITNSSAFKIRFCEIYSNTTDGLSVTSSGTDGEIYRNTIYLHQGAADNGVFVVNCSPSIKRNKIYDNDTGIRVKAYSGSTSVASPDIRNNVIYETEEYTMNYGILVRGLDGTANPTIFHNSIDGGSGDGIALERTSGTIAPTIKYNIITNCNDVGSVGITANTATGVTCAPEYNNVWGNTENYDGSVCTAGTGSISANPNNGQAGPLAADSPCIDAIPTGDPPNDGATMDYMGYSRPKGSGFDMGAYEYVATQTDAYPLPGGTGLQTDYDIFTIPLDIGTGLDMRNTLEGTLGTYNPATCRVFARTTSGDIEMNTQAFASLDIKPGMGFWGITVSTDTISFQGTLAPDAIYYKMELAPGWHLFAVPWPNTNIELGKIYVTDGVNQYAITNASNTLTDKYIWDYTGTGSSGYVQRSTSGFPLVAGTGYFIKVLGSSNIILAIPPDNDSTPPFNYSASASSAIGHESPESVRLPNDPEPPPLPDGSYGPVPDIKANGKSGPLTVSKGTPVSIAVSLDPGNRPVKKADWWVVARTPFKPPFDWYSYVYPKGWQPGIHVCVQTPPFQIPPSFEVLNMALPKGDYTLYFALDENADGIVDQTWVDSVEVRVE